MKIASIIMAAGRGSRMKYYDGNKTLLPLAPGISPFEGEHPILLHLFDNLPQGPKAVIVHHCKEAVMAVTRHLAPVYHEQPVLNGTGGAILAARNFIEELPCERFIITMGDVPFVKKATYDNLVDKLDTHELVVLGFRPKDKKKYGVLELARARVERITEWKYWKDYPAARQAGLTICNSGIYAVRKTALEKYLPVMASRPQVVQKVVNGKMTDIEEYFFTDLIEYMVKDNCSVGYSLTEDEIETLGVDDLEALETAQDYYGRQVSGASPRAL